MNRPHRLAPAFTLVEIMVSIALALLLILGINQVFSLTGKTVGLGQAVSATGQTGRTAQSVMVDDFHRAVQDPPLFIIHNERTFAFMDANDEQTDPDGDITTADFGNTGTPQKYYFYDINPRDHRLDRLSFFARGNFSRQTADDGFFVSSARATDAYITYGQGWLPDNSGTFLTPGTYPGQGNRTTNPNNYYARSWVLLRSPILLNNTGMPAPSLYGYARTTGPAGYLTPLRYNTASTDVPPSRIQSSRYDQAQTTIEQFRADLLGNLATVNWWAPMIYQQINVANPVATPAFRMQVNPFPVKPLTSLAAAQVAPYFAGHVSQFVVEYAGDFITQNNDPTDVTYGTNTYAYDPHSGNTTSPDGQVDWQLDIKGRYSNSAAIIYYKGDIVEDPTNLGRYYQYINLQPQNGASATLGNSTYWNFIPPYSPSGLFSVGNIPRKIRWYGLPRETSGDNIIDFYDVVPLRDVYVQLGVTPAVGNLLAASDTANYGSAAWFEQEVPTLPPTYAAMQNRPYSVPGATGIAPPASYTAADISNFRYTCVWANAGSEKHGMPAMVRIRMTVEDETGRLPGGQTFEFVLAPR